MSKILFGLFFIFALVSHSEETHILSNKKDTAKMEIIALQKGNTAMYCVPPDFLKEGLLKNSSIVLFNPQMASSVPLKSALQCYQCCVGEVGLTKEACASYANWEKGKDCSCHRK